MKNKKRILVVSLLVFLLTFTMAPVSYGDDWYEDYGSHYKVYNVKDNKLIFETARLVYKGDQYMSGDNKLYQVIRVNKDKKTAYAEFIRDVELPKIDKVAMEEFVLALRSNEGLAALVAEEKARKVGIYTTHSAESYVPTDGTESNIEGGGIKDVAAKLAENFKKIGVEGVYDNTDHVPHDAGAYKRSRRTAVQLLREQQPNALFDVHRDAIPAEQYLTELNGEPASKVRLVIGRRNQNFKANEETAQKIKAVGDEMYPGLIKDIFYAKGDYNQDLTPRAMLFEMGSFEHSRQRAEKSTGPLSEVLATVVFGGTFEANKSEGKGEGAAGDQKGGEKKQVTPQEDSNEGSGMGIAALLAVLGGGGLAFLFLSSGGKEWKSKISNFKQEFNSFLGRKRKRK
ncbi:stage II sporulation protein P [Alkaliphilus hydrothermalis]|uniref:Stage II sporulation protein P n=1 Tax=Alkaliphilus hydrothermalis TaxID=1482730 RepID=A0ABS2NNY7_9FIRM|nr:stage II sporulation protein P [Alkaliphilus hydrothermalis]MBM7614571.1 stage II sporulation protein P [Alkaliphilus hydrothermalis]